MISKFRIRSKTERLLKKPEYIKNKKSARKAKCEESLIKKFKSYKLKIKRNTNKFINKPQKSKSYYKMNSNDIIKDIKNISKWSKKQNDSNLNDSLKLKFKQIINKYNFSKKRKLNNSIDFSLLKIQQKLNQGFELKKKITNLKIIIKPIQDEYFKAMNNLEKDCIINKEILLKKNIFNFNIKNTKIYNLKEKINLKKKSILVTNENKKNNSNFKKNKKIVYFYETIKKNTKLDDFKKFSKKRNSLTSKKIFRNRFLWGQFKKLETLLIYNRANLKKEEKLYKNLKNKFCNELKLCIKNDFLLKKHGLDYFLTLFFEFSYKIPSDLEFPAHLNKYYINIIMKKAYYKINISILIRFQKIIQKIFVLKYQKNKKIDFNYFSKFLGLKKQQKSQFDLNKIKIEEDLDILLEFAEMNKIVFLEIYEYINIKVEKKMDIKNWNLNFEKIQKNFYFKSKNDKILLRNIKIKKNILLECFNYSNFLISKFEKEFLIFVKNIKKDFLNIYNNPNESLNKFKLIKSINSVLGSECTEKLINVKL